MNKKTEVASSSSEEEICMQALKEATNHCFFKHSITNEKKDKFAMNFKNKNIPHCDKLANYTVEQYQDYCLTQSSRNYIAQKLAARLDKEIILERSTFTNNIVRAFEDSGIRLFRSSKFIVTKSNIIDDFKKYGNRKQISVYNERVRFLKCKEVVVDSERILSQLDTKYWGIRKKREQLRYKKLKNGSLVQFS